MGRKLKQLSLLLIVVLAITPCFAQKHKWDSLNNVLKTAKDDTNKIFLLCDIARAVYRCECDSSHLVIKNSLAEAKDLAEKLNSQIGKAKVLYFIGLIEQITKPGDALSKLFEVAKMAELLKNINLEYDANTQICNIYYRLGNYSEDAVYAYKNLNIAEQLHDSLKLAGVYNTLGNLYSDEGKYSDAIRFHSKDLQFELKHNDSLRISHEYVNLGIDYLGEENYDSAIYYGNRAMYVQIKRDNKVGEAYSLGIIGEAYLGRKDYEGALGFFTKADEVLKPYQDESEKIETWNDLGKTNLELKNYKDALKFYFQAMNFGEKDKTYKYLVKAYLGLSKVYEAMGKTDEALNYYKLFSSYKDSVFNSEKANKIVSLAYQYQHQKEEESHQFDEEKKELSHQDEVKRARILIYSFVIGFILLLVLLFYIYRSFRIKHKANIIISQQNKIMEEKQKEIIDSITYAKRLQDAILPPLSLIKQTLPESFVLYKPKDIVAGDFYWVASLPSEGGLNTASSGISPLGRGGALLIAAADCTGHGVPGAMVSVVCSNALNRTVKEFKITEPGKILDKVRELVLETFEKSEDNVQDGMDISLCALSYSSPSGEETTASSYAHSSDKVATDASLPLGRDRVRVQWSGANNPLWYIHNKTLTEVTADKQPIGKYYGQKPFATHTLNLNKGDILYLFTDGYADQFGGPKGKKFKYRQLQEALVAMSDLSMDKQKEKLDTILNDWQSSLEQVDDVLVIGIRV